MQRRLEEQQVACPLCNRRNAVHFSRGRDFEYGTTDIEHRFVRCTACSAVYLNPRPSTKELKRIYPPNYFPHIFESKLNPIVKFGQLIVHKSRIRKYRKLAPPRARICDVGCGNGLLLNLLERYGDPTWQLYGNDFENTLAFKSKRVKFLKGRFETLKVKEKFDLIILQQVIEHLDDPVRVMKKAYELLNPGGHIIIETPNLGGLDFRIFRWRYWGGYHFPRHWTLFTAKSLRKTFARAGFKNIGVRYMNSPSFWVQSFHHLFLDKGFPRISKLFTVNNILATAVATAIDIIQTTLRLQTSNMQMIGRK